MNLIKLLSLPIESELPQASKDARAELMNAVEEKALIDRVAASTVTLTTKTELGLLVDQHKAKFSLANRVKLMDKRVEAAALRVLVIDGPRGQDYVSQLRIVEGVINSLERSIPPITGDALDAYVRLLSYNRLMMKG